MVLRASYALPMLHNSYGIFDDTLYHSVRLTHVLPNSYGDTKTRAGGSLGSEESCNRYCTTRYSTLYLPGMGPWRDRAEPSIVRYITLCAYSICSFSYQHQTVSNGVWTLGFEQ